MVRPPSSLPTRPGAGPSASPGPSPFHQSGAGPQTNNPPPIHYPAHPVSFPTYSFPQPHAQATHNAYPYPQFPIHGAGYPVPAMANAYGAGGYYGNMNGNGNGGGGGAGGYSGGYGWSGSAHAYAHQPQTSWSGPSTGGATTEPPNKRARRGGNDLPAHSTASDPMAWRNCSYKGCKYVGSGKDVEIHEGDRHLIFPRGRQVERSEEEEAYANHKGPPPPVFGTSITLHTEEDIAKWVAERKARWPSKARVEAKAAERQAALDRGENPDRKPRGADRRRLDPAARAEDWGRPDPPPPSKDKVMGAEQQRGGDRGAAPAPAPLLDYSSASEEYSSSSSSGSSSDSSDLDSDSDSGVDAGAQAKGDGAEHSTSAQSVAHKDKDQSQGQDGHADGRAKRLCRWYVKSGKCKFGSACNFAHPDLSKVFIDPSPTSTPPDTPRITPAPAPTPNPNSTANSNQRQRRAPAPGLPPAPPNPFDRPSMLGQLLAVPIGNTLSQLAQTMRFLVANDMLRGVELRPGDAEEAGRKRGLVRVISGREEKDQKEGGDEGAIQEEERVEGSVGVVSEE